MSITDNNAQQDKLKQGIIWEMKISRQILLSKMG